MKQVFLFLLLPSFIFSQNQVFEHGKNKKNEYSISALVINTKEKKLKKSTVSLIDSEGIVIQEKKTDKKGHVRFDNVNPGIFVLKAYHKKFGYGLIHIRITNQNLEEKIIVPSSLGPKPIREAKPKNKSLDQSRICYKYWSPYRRKLSLRGNPQTFYGEPYYEVTYNKDKRIKTVTEFDENNKKQQTWHLRWTRSGNRSEYYIEFHTRGSISRLDHKLYSQILSEVRPGWKAFFKSRKDGRPKSLYVEDHLGIKYYSYNFTYAAQIDSVTDMEVIESSYFRSDTNFAGRHIVFMEDAKWLRMVQYFDKNNKIKNTVEYIHNQELEETTQIKLDQNGKELERKIIPFMRPDQFAYSLEWTGRKVIVHETEDVEEVEIAELIDEKDREVIQYTSWELLSPSSYRDSIIASFPPRPFFRITVWERDKIKFGNTDVGLELSWVDHYSNKPTTNLRTIGIYAVARSDISKLISFLPDIYTLQYKYGLGLYSLGYGFTTGFAFSPFIDLRNLDSAPVPLKISLVGNIVIAKGVLQDIDYVTWATLGINLTLNKNAE